MASIWAATGRLIHTKTTTCVQEWTSSSHEVERKSHTKKLVIHAVSCFRNNPAACLADLTHLLHELLEALSSCCALTTLLRARHSPGRTACHCWTVTSSTLPWMGPSPANPAPFIPTASQQLFTLCQNSFLHLQIFIVNSCVGLGDL